MLMPCWNSRLQRPCRCPLHPLPFPAALEENFTASRGTACALRLLDWTPPPPPSRHTAQDTYNCFPSLSVQKTLREKEQRRMQRALRVIGGNHMRNLASAGPTGWFAMIKLFFVMVRIFCGALLHIVQDDLSRRWKAIFGGKGNKDSDQQAEGGKTDGAGSSGNGNGNGSPAAAAAPAV